MGSEVLIIGGGVIGLSIARELVQKGVRDILIVERRAVGAEASWAAAGMLSPNIETLASDYFHRFGVESLAMYPAFAESLLDETDIDIELDQTGTLCLAFDEDEARRLRGTYQQQKKAGVPVKQLAGNAIRELEPALSANILGGLSYPKDWQVENRKLLAALRRFADLNRIKFIENTEVSELFVEGGHVRGALTSSGKLAADITVVATGAWTSLIKIGGAAMPFNVRPIRGQMVSFLPEEKMLRHVVYSPRGYVVPRANRRILIGATVEDKGFDSSTTRTAAVSLKRAAVEIVPKLGKIEITDHWSGLRPLADGLPIIGVIPGYENAFVATAHYRNGILLAPLTGKIIADNIVDGSDSEYFRAFTADRFGSIVTNAVGGKL